MWLCTEDRKLINVDHVLFFDLSDTRIVANFPPTAGGEARDAATIMVKRYPSREAASAAYDGLMAGLDDLLDIEDLSLEAMPAR